MNEVFDRIYKFYGVIPPLNKNQGFYLDISHQCSKHIIPGSVESAGIEIFLTLKSSLRKRRITRGKKKGGQSKCNK